MAYLDTEKRPSAGSMAAVIAVHAAMGAALVLGLTVSGVISPQDGPIIAIPLDPPKPPPPPEPTTSPTQAATRDPYVPELPLPLPPQGPIIDKAEEFPLPLPPVPQPGPSQSLKPVVPVPLPSFAPTAAKPRNDPLRWVTPDDYRGNWIRQTMTGKARFRLELAADGRVTSCTITATSGHPELDAATCALVAKRARFQPARGSEGGAVTGSYSNAIDWRLPERE